MGICSSSGIAATVWKVSFTLNYFVNICLWLCMIWHFVQVYLTLVLRLLDDEFSQELAVGNIHTTTCIKVNNHSLHANDILVKVKYIWNLPTNVSNVHNRYFNWHCSRFVVVHCTVNQKHMAQQTVSFANL